MPKIDDGKGRGFQAEVNDEQELVVRSIVESEIEHASAEGNAFTWNSNILDIDAGDTMLFVKNEGDIPLVLDRLIINGTNVICTWDLNIGSLTTPPTGTVVPSVNLNRSFASKVAPATAVSDELDIADGDTFDSVKTLTDVHHIHPLNGVILGRNQYIQINQETEATSGSLVLYGHFEVPS